MISGGGNGGWHGIIKSIEVSVAKGPPTSRMDKVGFLVCPKMFGKCLDSASGQTSGAMDGFVLNHPRDDGLAGKNR
jgi:hypothetical protein